MVMFAGLSLTASGAAFAQPQGQRVGQPATPAASAPKKTRKLPPGTRGFEQFAGRDASDKLITGGATRSVGAVEPYAAAIQRGTDAYEAGKYQEAVAAFQSAVKAKPDQFVARYSLGVAYEALGQFKEAAEAYKSAISLKPDSEDADLLAYYNLGNIYASSNRHKEAIEVYQQVVHRQPGLFVVHYNMGLSYAALNQSKEAAAAFREALRRMGTFKQANPEEKVAIDYLVYYNLGVAQSKLEQYPEAIESFKQSIALKPDYAPAHYNLGLAYFYTDDAKGIAEQQRLLKPMRPEMADELAKLIGK